MQRLAQQGRAAAPGRRASGGGSGACAPLQRRPVRQLGSRPRRGRGVAAAASKEADLEAQLEAFMRQQAERESGAAFARTREPAQTIGAEVVSDEDAKAYCREIIAFLRTLKAQRDMGPMEAKLVVAIEDPAARERRKLGIEDERGVSRDEMAAALDEVAQGRIPTDRVALKCLYEELASWPDLGGPGQQ